MYKKTKFQCLKLYYGTSSSSKGIQILLTPNDSIRSLLGFNPSVIREEYNLSDNPVDILSFDNILLECDSAQGNIFKGRRSGIIHNFTTDVDPDYNYIENFPAGIQWCMMQSKDFVPSISFELKK